LHAVRVRDIDPTQRQLFGAALAAAACKKIADRIRLFPGDED
jgi:hypothetical protein